MPLGVAGEWFHLDSHLCMGAPLDGHINDQKGTDFTSWWSPEMVEEVSNAVDGVIY
jgi:hypothetical protein